MTSIPFAFVTRDVDYVPCQICQEGKIANSRGECEKIDELLRIDSCKLHFVLENKILCAVCEKNYVLTLDNQCISVDSIANCEI